MIAYYGTLECNDFKVKDAKYLDWGAFGAKHDIRRYDFSRFKGIITERSSGETLYTWIEKMENLSEFDTIAVQIIYTCTMMDQIGLVHNDLHSKNLFIDDLGKGNRVTMEFCIDGKNVIEINTRYIVKIFDWDRSVKVSTEYSPDEVIKPKGNKKYAQRVPDPKRFAGKHVAILDRLVWGGNISRVIYSPLYNLVADREEEYQKNRIFWTYFMYLYDMFYEDFYTDKRMAFGLWVPEGEMSFFHGQMIDHLYNLGAIIVPGDKHVSLRSDPSVLKELRNCNRNIFALPSAQEKGKFAPFKATTPSPLKFTSLQSIASRHGLDALGEAAVKRASERLTPSRKPKAVISLLSPVTSPKKPKGTIRLLSPETPPRLREELLKDAMVNEAIRARRAARRAAMKLDSITSPASKRPEVMVNLLSSATPPKKPKGTIRLLSPETPPMLREAILQARKSSRKQLK
jgi:hypothetical protein